MLLNSVEARYLGRGQGEGVCSRVIPIGFDLMLCPDIDKTLLEIIQVRITPSILLFSENITDRLCYEVQRRGGKLRPSL